VNAPLQNLVGLLDARVEQLEQQGGGETAVEKDEEATAQSVAEAPAETTEDQEPAPEAEAPATDEAKEE
jgi:hypothetical protein